MNGKEQVLDFCVRGFNMTTQDEKLIKLIIRNAKKINIEEVAKSVIEISDLYEYEYCMDIIDVFKHDYPPQFSEELISILYDEIVNED
jgi:hypothetical protein